MTLTLTRLSLCAMPCSRAFWQTNWLREHRRARGLGLGLAPRVAAGVTAESCLIPHSYLCTYTTIHWHVAHMLAIVVVFIVACNHVDSVGMLY